MTDYMELATSLARKSAKTIETLTKTIETLTALKLQSEESWLIGNYQYTIHWSDCEDEETFYVQRTHTSHGTTKTLTEPDSRFETLGSARIAILGDLETRTRMGES